MKIKLTKAGQDHILEVTGAMPGDTIDIEARVEKDGSFTILQYEMHDQDSTTQWNPSTTPWTTTQWKETYIPSETAKVLASNTITNWDWASTATTTTFAINNFTYGTTIPSAYNTLLTEKYEGVMKEQAAPKNPCYESGWKEYYEVNRVDSPDEGFEG